MYLIPFTIIVTPYIQEGRKMYQDSHTIWMIVHGLTKLAHFLPIKMSHNMDRLVHTHTHVDEIFKLLGVPITIVSNVIKNLQKSMWTKLRFIINCLLIGNRRTVWKNHSNIRRYVACIFDGFWRQLKKRLPHVKFTNNNSYQATIGMTPCMGASVNRDLRWIGMRLVSK